VSELCRDERRTLVLEILDETFDCLVALDVPPQHLENVLDQLERILESALADHA